MEPDAMKQKGFSLIELLVVIALLGIVSAFAVPALQNLSQAGKMTQGASAVLDEIESARQIAEVGSSLIEVRFLKRAGSTNYSGLQLWSTDSTPAPLAKAIPLPDGIVILDDDNLSPWLKELTLNGSIQNGPWSEGSFVAFRIRPSGPIIPSTLGRNEVFLTVAPDRPYAGSAPPNYCTIQLNPDSGRTFLFRP
jgi:uncharacterized protein (TIGR02596 family)